jgi:hypothetical protein
MDMNTNTLNGGKGDEIMKKLNAVVTIRLHYGYGHEHVKSRKRDEIIVIENKYVSRKLGKGKEMK